MFILIFNWILFNFNLYALFMMECRVYLGLQHQMTNLMTSGDLPT